MSRDPLVATASKHLQRVASDMEVNKQLFTMPATSAQGVYLFSQHALAIDDNRTGWTEIIS